MHALAGRHSRRPGVVQRRHLPVRLDLSGREGSCVARGPPREEDGSDGVLLIYHEQWKFMPYMVIEALKKYALLDRFTVTVKSNGFFSILVDLIISRNETRGGFEGNVAYRARNRPRVDLKCIVSFQ